MIGGLIDAFAVSCVRMERGEPVPDGQGGFTNQWREGGAFSAALTDKRSAQRVSAEKRGVSEGYNVTTPIGVHLMAGDVFRRRQDGATFRATSNYTDTSPPKCAGFAFEQVTAERWDLA